MFLAAVQPRARSRRWIPNVVGTSAASATKRLEDVGLRVVSRVRWTGGDLSRVISEQPAVGAVQPKDTITIVVTRPGRLIPAVVGLPARSATDELRRAGFTLTVIGRAGDLVVAQRPGRGWAAPHTHVKLRFLSGSAARVFRVERAFAATGFSPLTLTSVRCLTAHQAGVFDCSGFSAATDSRLAKTVSLAGDKVVPWVPPKQKHNKHHPKHHTKHGPKSHPKQRVRLHPGRHSKHRLRPHPNARTHATTITTTTTSPQTTTSR